MNPRFNESMSVPQAVEVNVEENGVILENKYIPKNLKERTINKPDKSLAELSQELNSLIIRIANENAKVPLKVKDLVTLANCLSLSNAGAHIERDEDRDHVVEGSEENYNDEEDYTELESNINTIKDIKCSLADFLEATKEVGAYAGNEYENHLKRLLAKVEFIDDNNITSSQIISMFSGYGDPDIQNNTYERWLDRFEIEYITILLIKSKNFKNQFGQNTNNDYVVEDSKVEKEILLYMLKFEDDYFESVYIQNSDRFEDLVLGDISRKDVMARNSTDTYHYPNYFAKFLESKGLLPAE
jgi:hypothetical protein